MKHYLYREISEIRNRLGMYGWKVKEEPKYLVIDIKGVRLNIDYNYIKKKGSDSVVRYVKSYYYVNRLEWFNKERSNA